MESPHRQKVVEIIEEELKNCTVTGGYPQLCNWKSSPHGREKIYDMVIAIIEQDPMPISSALAQVESSIAT